MLGGGSLKKLNERSNLSNGNVIVVTDRARCRARLQSGEIACIVVKGACYTSTLVRGRGQAFVILRKLLKLIQL